MVGTIDHLASNLADNTELFEMSKADGDEAAVRTIEAEAHTLRGTVEQLEFRRMFSNSADPLNCFVDIRPAPVAPKPATGPACCCAST